LHRHASSPALTPRGGSVATVLIVMIGPFTPEIEALCG
jgi:hypothetical protein